MNIRFPRGASNFLGSRGSQHLAGLCFMQLDVSFAITGSERPALVLMAGTLAACELSAMPECDKRSGLEVEVFAVYQSKWFVVLRTSIHTCN
jgi:hypothetical protein